METKEKTKSVEELVIDDRIEQFVNMGFVPDQAILLAKARDLKGVLISRYKIKKALDQGCSIELAAKIFS